MDPNPDDTIKVVSRTPTTAAPARTVRVQRADLDVQVLAHGADGTQGWFDGVLAEWRQDDAGAWSGWVRWHRGPGENLIDVFPADHIREAPPVDRRPHGHLGDQG